MDDLIRKKTVLEMIPQYVSDAEEGSILCYDIEHLPPEQQWIPCSERLPDEGCEVLVSAWTGEVGLGTRHEGENAFWRLDTNITVNMANIIAWMPLPKPYKG